MVEKTARNTRINREYATAGDRGVRHDGTTATVKHRTSTCVGSNLSLHRIHQDVSNADVDCQGVLAKLSDCLKSGAATDVWKNW